LNAYGLFPWSRGLGFGSAAAGMLRLRIWFPPVAWMPVSSDCCVLSDRGLCNEPIPRPESSSRVWCVCVISKPEQWVGLCSTDKVLRSIVNAPWYVQNRILHADLLIPTVREEVTKHSVAHKNKLRLHPNQLIPILLEGQRPKRLKR
jgi:hypothetical protein